MKSTRIKIDEKLYFSISEYCKINNLKIEDYVNSLLKKKFMVDKYGDRPAGNTQVVPQKEPIIIPSVSVEEVTEENSIQTFEKNSGYTTEEKVIETIEHEENVLEVIKKKNIRKLK